MLNGNGRCRWTGRHDNFDQHEHIFNDADEQRQLQQRAASRKRTADDVPQAGPSYKIRRIEYHYRNNTGADVHVRMVTNDGAVASAAHHHLDNDQHQQEEQEDRVQAEEEEEDEQDHHLDNDHHQQEEQEDREHEEQREEQPAQQAEGEEEEDDQQEREEEGRGGE